MQLLQKITGLILLLAMSVASMAAETVLVGGVTGRQGMAVAEELLARGYAVRGMARKPASEEAKAMAGKGVVIVQGDYGDPESLLAAMQGVDKLFFYSGFSPNELQEGLNVIAAAKAAGVEYVVYSSGAAAEPGVGVEGSVKAEVEQALIASGLEYTVLRPVAFMENFDKQQKRTAKMGIVDSRAPDRQLHFIAIRDIGRLAGEAFDHPDEWSGKALNIAGDSMSVQEYVDTFSKVMGRPVTYTRMPLEEYLASMPKPLRPLFQWYDEVGYSADVNELRKRYPDMLTLEQYLRATGWANWQE
jgi:uncharacterized protein YbjT (DUF2867 family)